MQLSYTTDITFLTLQYCLVTLLELHKPSNRTCAYTTVTPQITQLTQPIY